METIRGIGKLRISNKIEKKDGMLVTSDLLEKVIKEFIKKTVKAMDVIGDCPFAVKERQIHSILAPSISNVVDAFEMETKVDRNWRSVCEQDNDSHGWLDYWCYYRNRSFFIELKHDYISYVRKGITDSLKNGWDTAIKQLQAITENAKYSASDCEGTVRISLSIVPIYYRVSETKEIKVNEDEMIKIQDNLMDNLGGANTKPNWSALWMLHENYSKVQNEYIHGLESYRYPGLIFCAYVFDIVR